MNNEYELVSDLNLTLGAEDLPITEHQQEMPEYLRPSAEMQDKFMQNCVALGILRKV